MAAYFTEANTPAAFVTVGVVSAQVFAGHRAAESVFLSNSSANSIWVSLGTTAAVVGSGILVPANGGVVIDRWRGPIQGIATGAGSNLGLAVI